MNRQEDSRTQNVDISGDIDVEEARPVVVHLIDTAEVRETRAHNIKTYDLSDKEFADWKGKIPGALYDELEKLTRIMRKAEEEHRQHPNDETRLLVLESIKQKQSKVLEESVEHYLLQANAYDEQQVDILKLKKNAEIK
jgi:hypothetical protein